MQQQVKMNADKSQIVVYQPNETVRLDVRFDNETVWMPQSQIAELFACSLENVRLHLKNIYASGELDKSATSKESLEVRQEGNRSVTRRFTYYNLDAVISIGYRVNSIIGVKFRQWATQIIKERMLAGAAQAAQFAAIDRRLLSHERDIAESLTARRCSGPAHRSRTPDALPSLRGCLCTLRVRLSPNLPSEMLRISAAHLQDGPRNHPRTSRLNPQGDNGTPRIRKRQKLQG